MPSGLSSVRVCLAGLVRVPGTRYLADGVEAQPKLKNDMPQESIDFYDDFQSWRPDSHEFA